MYKPIVGTLGYILSPDGNNTLLVHRTARSDDHHLGKYNGLGGKMEPGEDVYSCLVREIREESGLVVTEAVLRGTVNWPGFGPDGQDWLGFIFLVTGFIGEPASRNEEGDLAWHPVASLLSLPMWEGDRYFIPLVFDGDPRIFHGHMPYENGRPLSWSYSRM
ncbi:NUDIX hydrolase [Desulfolithobacter sp.]